MPGSEPAGVAGDAFYVLGMYGVDGGLTVDELHQAITRENESIGWPVPSPGQVARALRYLARRGLVEQARRGWWRQTGHGHRMLAVWCGEDEPEPCGLGWPA